MFRPGILHAAFNGTRQALSVLVFRPKPLRRDVRALAQCLEFLPNHGLVNLGPVKRLGREAAIGACHDLLAKPSFHHTPEPFEEPLVTACHFAR